MSNLNVSFEIDLKYFQVFLLRILLRSYFYYKIFYQRVNHSLKIISKANF